MLKNITSNWNLSRVIRLGFGILIIADGVNKANWQMATLGGLFALLPILNIGCGFGGNCGVPVSKKAVAEPKEITYEEVR